MKSMLYTVDKLFDHACKKLLLAMPAAAIAIVRVFYARIAPARIEGLGVLL